MSEESWNAFEFASVPYKRSINNELKKCLLFGVITYLITGFGSNEWLLSISLGILVFAVSFIKAKKWYRFNIEKINIENIVQIVYTEKGETKIVKIPINKLKVSIKMGISKGRVPYLNLTLLESGDTITQYEVGEWDESRMESVKSKFDDIQI